ncbi:MAG: SDR family oxidoreductase [Halodesulfurarchaeum sp.]
MERTVLITGCSSGIGHATAEAYLDADWTVYATARDEGDLEDLADAGCRTAELDVTKPARCTAVVERVIDETGRLDCLVNNAGFGQYGTVEDVPTRRLHRQFDVNLYGPHRLIRAVLPHMREVGDGTIVNVSSVSGRLAAPVEGAYAASKFALEALSDSLRAEVAEFGIDVVLVEPGPVKASFDDRVADELDALDRTDAYDGLYEAYEDARLLVDMGEIEPEAVAAVILEAGTSTDPAPRYPVGGFARLTLLARFLPDRWRDAIIGLLRRLS